MKLHSDGRSSWEKSGSLALKLVMGLTLALGGASSGFAEATAPPADTGHETAADVEPGLRGAPLWAYRSADLDERLRAAIKGIGLQPTVDAGRLAVALVDITDPQHPRVASIHGDKPIYAASLPKIGVLLATFQHAHDHQKPIDAATRRDLLAMIRSSSNAAATRLIHRVTKPYIAEVLRSPRYALYDPAHGGGLWVGKDYAKKGVWRRDPIANLSHAATAIQVARFYYLLDTEQLVSPAYSREMKVILGVTSLDHKFVLGLQKVRPWAGIFRKSGTWRDFHADGALVERRDGARYIAVALTQHPKGSKLLPRIIIELDRLIPRPEPVSLAAPGRD